MLEIIKKLPPFKTAIAVAGILIQAICALYLPYVTAEIVTGGIMTGDIAYIQQKGLVMLALTAVSLLGALVNVFFTAKLAYRLGNDLREELYTRFLSFSRREYDKFGAASLITRATNDVTQVQSLVELGLKFMILCPIYLVGAIVLTARLSITLSLIYLAALPVLALSAIVVYRYANPLYGKMQRFLDKLNLLFREGITGVKVIRAFNREPEDQEKYYRTNQEFTQASITAATIMSIFVPLITMVVGFTSIAVIWAGGKGLEAGNMDLGAITGAIGYSTQILMGFNLLTMVIMAIPKGQISAQRVLEVIDTVPHMNDPAVMPEQKNSYKTLSVNHVSFGYQGASRQALNNISFTAEPGQTVAVIGSTGDGKTTLLNLIGRHYEVEAGSIRIGETNIRQMPLKELRSRISSVPQKSNLFMGTIRENLAMGNPRATEQQMWAALERAQATEFVDSLDDWVAKNGGNYSGGQRQRLCIARALVKDADIYIFDDSFSALDMKTDRQIRTAMSKSLKGAVTILVTQRVSTAMDADCIVVLDKGELAGQGTHEELKKNCMVYQEIIQSQMDGEVAA